MRVTKRGMRWWLNFAATDEALMTQVAGTKEVLLLLPPDQRSWNALFPVASETGFLLLV